MADKNIFEHVRDLLNKTVPGTRRKPRTAEAKTGSGKQNGPLGPVDGRAKAPDLQAQMHKRDADIRAAIAKAKADDKTALVKEQSELAEVRRKYEAELARQAARHVESADTTYTIVRGDTLSGIAKRFLGSAGRWPEVHAANKAQIPNPNLIYPGQTITIPPR